jgi:hypothetical protein
VKNDYRQVRFLQKEIKRKYNYGADKKLNVCNDFKCKIAFLRNMRKKCIMRNWKQLKSPCLCGSMYCVDSLCVKCGKEQKIDEGDYAQDHYIPMRKGAGWDKKQHKVIWR